MAVNNAIVDDPAFQVDDKTDIILVDGKSLPNPDFVYLLLNKPAKTVTTVSDERGRNTVIDLVHTGTRIFPVGRLDYDTGGILLLTNDGELANRLLHPKYEIAKTYRALLSDPLSEAEMRELARGVSIGRGERAKPDSIRKVPGKKGREYELTLHEGKKHEVKRIFRAVGKRVVRLERTAFAGIVLKKLEPGRWRSLTKGEIQNLKKLAGLAESAGGA